MLAILKHFLTPEFVGKIVRTGVQSASASLVTSGLINGDEQTALAGAFGLIASVAWTALAHWQARAIAPNATIGGLQ